MYALNKYFQMIPSPNADRYHYCKINSLYLLGIDVRCSTTLSFPLCMMIPNYSSSRRVYLIFPMNTNGSDYCTCVVNRLPQDYSNCLAVCQSPYQFSLNGATMCLQNNDNLMIHLNGLPKYLFAHITDYCPSSQCTILSFISVIWIRPTCK